MKEFWNKRYTENQWCYGQAPNLFFKNTLKQLKPGKLLLAAEGEGRNAIYAASLGWQVTCFDFSKIARERALEWAKREGLKIDYKLCSYNEFQTDEKFDLIGVFYFHLESVQRKKFHKQILDYLKPYGYLVMEVFNKGQIEKNSGGPPNLDMLYSKEDIQEDFLGLDLINCEELEVQINQGTLHQGAASILQFFAQKF